MTQHRTPPQTLSRPKRNRVILGVVSAVFLILFGLYIVLFTQPLSQLNADRPAQGVERGTE